MTANGPLLIRGPASGISLFRDLTYCAEKEFDVSTSRTNLLLLLALYVCWGTAIPAMKVMVETFPPIAGAALIFLLGGIILAVMARHRPRPEARKVGQLALAGVTMLVGGQGLAMIALTEVTASVGAILAAAIPLWVVVLSTLIGIRISFGSVVRLAIGFGGIAVVVFTAPDASFGGAAWAIGLFCIAPVLWAAGSLLTAHTKQPFDLVLGTSIQLLAGGVCLAGLSFVTGEFEDIASFRISPLSTGAAAYLLIFDSLIGFLLYTRLLKTAPPQIVSSYAYVTPIVGAVIGAVFFNEPIWFGALLGGAMVIGAVMFELRKGLPVVDPVADQPISAPPA
jgi:drug/metabolite transporter (DMT)-like permease